MAFRLVLASQSPRRRELLDQLGVAHEVRPANTDESVHPGEPARAYVLRVAREKARAVEGELVLAADTAVVLRGEVLGKPRDAEDARRMLAALSGTAHEVLTGVCVRRRPGRGSAVELDAVVSTAVRFAPLGPAEISWYVATGEPLDKAGAYAIQGVGGAFVLGVEGSVSNVVGLPLAETAELLRRAGHPLPWDAPGGPAQGGGAP
ncbi:nucleoside triphosphate pyrophosphatase [Anaeromyxobacter sp. Fw109-5]|uniref:dTTP/UTP pyrophosphatase n=1 Tax=Anaeromyxobacter sp. (strain Fw109-5) TaxID=404589 RepID=NTPPA_ANADF|nr:Maf family protein [Anaeromyxobacter sp. Fw109-5]A7HA27.1 RecName: Full=dTTP/UTP pyrophosphatase; Short=dTTPase/UTPase; AltName: Full=Nucleoside triphosphate pyrophosphatase; AltName: Full=Nucleotide pyrophosphatase; Short=Nucleotide PPase [Anaeromyxobacter sp. Fw109-5]ABS25573.1 maf protein [Anaeromyxobacter sp. Fw109-5]